MADNNNLWKLVHGTKDCTAECGAEDIESNKLLSILSYIGILWLIPLFLAKNSKFAKFHVNQGIILSIIGIIAWVLGGILGGIALIGWIFGIIFWVLRIVWLAYAVLGIYNVITGKAKELPFIGGYSIIK